MDEADTAMIGRLAQFLNENRKDEWMDIHNVRIQQYGSNLHIDGHITLPWYFELRAAHAEMEEMIKLVAKNTDRAVEFNFHMDDCRPPVSCTICNLKECPVRQHAQVKKVPWTTKTISQKDKHSAEMQV